MLQRDPPVLGNALKKLEHGCHWWLRYPLKCGPAVG